LHSTIINVAIPGAKFQINMLIHQQVSNLLQHIQKHWERANGEDDRISRIDRDILSDDLRKLYDLIFELHVGVPVTHVLPSREDALPDGTKKQNPEAGKISAENFTDNQEQEFEFFRKIEEKEPEAPPRQNPGEIILEVVNEPENFPSFVDKPVGQQHEENGGEISKSPADYIEPATPEPAKEPKLYNSDKFSAPKTFADIYSKNGDNSLAAKIQKNNIADIKTAIGINDRFLFINSIFDGDANAYKNAIDQFNKFENYTEALHLSEVIKSRYSIKDELALGRLMEIVRRKFI